MTKCNSNLKPVKKQRVTNTKLFIERAVEVHGNAYSYENSFFKRSSEKVNITCPTHGAFWQTPNAHLSGKGCATCGGSSASDTASFIKKAQAKHPGLYTYDKVKYVRSNRKVIITCSVHGDFLQTPADHLSPRGCKACGHDKRGKLSKSNTQEFIVKARLVHGNNYHYDNVVYETAIKPVVITCGKHGDFKQTPNKHLNGSGCSKCWRERVLLANSKSSDYFFKEVKLRHGARYDYSQAVYRGADKKIKIRCYEHGHFWQEANSHLRGANCPQCSGMHSGFKRSTFKLACMKNGGVGFLYVINCYKSGESFYKIGITSNSVKQRFRGKGSMPYKYKVISLISGKSDFIFDIERSLHAVLKNERYEPKTAFDGMTECFSTISPVKKLLQKLDSTDQLQLLA